MEAAIATGLGSGNRSFNGALYLMAFATLSSSSFMLKGLVM